jgi:REP element-mobilizing transposase RayT
LQATGLNEIIWLHIKKSGISISSMAKLVGYMVTFTTYGTWLQGDKRGYVKDGKRLEGDQRLLELCKDLQKGQTIKLTKREKEIVREAILNEAERIGQKLEALVICTNHVHLAVRSCDKSIERIVSMYKSVSTRALRSCGQVGRIWTKGFNKRFCFTQHDLERKIAYVRNHE